MKYLDASQEASKAFYLRGITGPVVMLNLLEFNEIADYSESKELSPLKEISGEEAYELYVNHTLPFLEEAGGDVLFQGKGGGFLIGLENEKWDMVLQVKHASVAAFMKLANNDEYLKGMGHRKAALKDSRLLPIELSNRK